MRTSVVQRACWLCLRFKRRLDLYSSLWCCMDGHPGHVWYDFWWDTEPHHDRHERWIDGSWYPQMGP